MCPTSDEVKKRGTLQWNHGTCSCCGREAMVRLVIIHGTPYRSCSRACDAILVEDYDTQR